MTTCNLSKSTEATILSELVVVLNPPLHRHLVKRGRINDIFILLLNERTTINKNVIYTKYMA
jgi:hypothetical protein